MTEFEGKGYTPPEEPRQKMGHGYHFRTEHPEIRLQGPNLEPHQYDYLLFMARGGKNAEVSKQLRTSIPTLVRVMADINTRLRTENLPHAIATAVAQGILAPDAILEGFDPSKLANLSLDSTLLLTDLLADESRDTSYRTISDKYKTTEKSIKEKYRRLFTKIGTKNKEHTVAVLSAINKKREQTHK